MLEASATGHVVSNFALQHLSAAVVFRNHAARLQTQHLGQPLGSFFEELRSYCSGCIMSSSASLEALINELFIDPNCGLRPRIPDFETEFWGDKGIERKPPLDKYQYALEMLGKPKLDKGGNVFRDTWAVVELRNALVHFKPLWDPEHKRRIRLTDVLTRKYAHSPFVDSGADFVTMKSMSPECASWVIKTVFAFLREFDAHGRLNDDKMQSFWTLERACLTQSWI